MWHRAWYLTVISVLSVGYLTAADDSLPQLLVISLDGFRWDYLQKADTPNFDLIASEGVSAEYVVDAFPSHTFPNHFTLVTGLYPAYHGIVDNAFYDPDYRESFSAATSVTEGKWFDAFGAEPIWSTNQIDGRPGASSGCYFWLGCEAEIGGVRPRHYATPYNKSVAFRTRIDTVTSWLTGDANVSGDNLVLLYYHEPDSTGHQFGPDSKEVQRMIEVLDSDIGYLVQKLSDAGLWDNMNLIITSDHGMATVNCSQYNIQLDQYVDVNLFSFFKTADSVVNVWNTSEDVLLLNELVHNLSDVQHLSVYTKDNSIPSSYHYSNNRRIGPVLLVSEYPYIIVQHADECRWFGGGSHGWNNSASDMHPFFLARGPSFRRDGLESRPFLSVDVYPLMCHLVGVSEPPPNNGSLRRVQHLLQSRAEGAGPWDWRIITGIAVPCGLLVIVLVTVVVVCRRRHRPKTIGVVRGANYQSTSTSQT